MALKLWRKDLTNNDVGDYDKVLAEMKKHTIALHKEGDKHWNYSNQLKMIQRSSHHLRSYRKMKTK
ncbi:MAG: hypothetical protein GYA02_09980 [Clostridiaceae bacterium]|nr:hypothetical protein [Clostridiaceae bacterium]